LDSDAIHQVLLNIGMVPFWAQTVTLAEKSQ
jgi:hypothetical protein